MVRRHTLAEANQKPHKIEHQEDILAQIQRSNAILISTIKTLETQFQQRGLLTGFDGSFYPVWFLSEQERNVFLWRKGCSIIEASDYEFWIDLNGLIEKRKNQLKTSSIGNPFITPDCMSNYGDDEMTYSTSKDKELFYLSTFQELFKKIDEYASAFSIATSNAIEQDIDYSVRILLPHSPSLQATKE